MDPLSQPLWIQASHAEAHLTLPCLTYSWVLCIQKVVSWRASTRSSVSWVVTLLTSSRASPLPLPRPWRILSVTLAGKVGTGAGC